MNLKSVCLTIFDQLIVLVVVEDELLKYFCIELDRKLIADSSFDLVDEEDCLVNDI
jgi:protein associated with RNAse G/E